MDAQEDPLVPIAPPLELVGRPPGTYGITCKINRNKVEDDLPNGWNSSLGELCVLKLGGSFHLHNHRISRGSTGESFAERWFSPGRGFFLDL